MLKKIIVKLFDLLDYSIIKKKKLTKIDVERKHYKHQLDKYLPSAAPISIK